MSDLFRLNQLLNNGLISRREFIGRALALGMSLPAIQSLAAENTSGTRARNGGHFRIAISFGETTNTLDPAIFADTYMMLVGFAARNCLTEISNKDELIPELAESWEPTSDAKSWTFKLRKGVEFHNGKTLVADDVIASIQHHLGSDSRSAAKGILSSIEAIKKQDKYTITFTLAQPNVDFPYLLSDYHVTIQPEKDGKTDWQSGVGTGGYRIKRFEPGVVTELERYPNYWKENHAHFDSVDVSVVHDVTARTNALLSGAVDAIDNVDLKTAHLLSRRSGVKIEEAQGNQHYNYPMMTDVAPYNDINVRLALKYACPREDILDKLLAGHGYLGNDHPIGRANRFYNPNLEQKVYDPERAKFYLKKADVSRLDVELDVSEASWPGAVEGAILFSEAAKKAGINLKVNRRSNDGFTSTYWMVKPWTASYWSGRVTEDWMFSQTYAADAPWNETHWKNERFNKLLVAARSELDTDKRREMYYEMQQLVSDRGGAITPIFSNFVWATSDKVDHHQLSATWDLDGVKCLERWWLA